VRWVAEHQQRDALALVEGGISRWESMQEAEGKHSKEGDECVRIAREIMERNK
jgi:hypothetical protein